MKPMIGRFLRQQVRRVKRFLERLDPEPEPGPYNSINPAFAYASINKTLTTLMSEHRELYPQYTWGVLQAAHLATTLGIRRISVIEFGVAGGNGLVALERASERAEAERGVQIDVHGFDTGQGLPPPTDFRDLPHLYRPSEYRMDVDELRPRLERAKLHIGLVADTLKEFLESKPAPIGFASFDLDLYSSTVDAFTIFEQKSHDLTLPRVHCYFDDIMGLSFSEFTGERRAIEEFNTRHERRKIAQIFGLKYFLPPKFSNQQWAEMFYLAHMFDHPLSDRPDGLTLNAQRPLAQHLTRSVAPICVPLADFVVSYAPSAAAPI